MRLIVARLAIFVWLAGLTPLAFAAANPNQGPGGPILVITSPSSTFGNFYAEILRNEGLNEFAVAEISTVSASTLSAYDIVILAKTELLPNQVSMFTDWVTAGGNLIAMAPDPQLASLLGLTASGSPLTNGYLLVDTSTTIGNGIVDQTMQFHGSADRYVLNGASSLATLYATASTPTTNPAVTLRSVGSNDGHAAAFTYDLAASIVYTRQGNPAWATQERDGVTPIRSDDKFFGLAASDPQPDWIDLSKVTIPQADEQQRLLANLILSMNLARKPLPRFWYLPNAKKAAVIMTGDDHGTGGTVARFNQFTASSPTGCSLTNWECVRGTSYIYTSTPMTNAQAAAFEANGFEVGLHINTGCADFTPESLEVFYSQQIPEFLGKYTGVPPPSTQRHHCIAWSDWATGAKVQFNHGIRLDTSYYYWPPGWVNNVPGHFTGSAMPMRFADLDGTLIDVYQAVTQMTDESEQAYPYTIDTLLDRALGPQEHYGVFTVNAHTDNDASDVADAVVASAQSRGVPIVSSRQMLTWLDGRNNSSFSGLSWTGSSLSFTVVPGIGASGLLAMVPGHSSSGVLSGLTHNGSAVSFTLASAKGTEYASFPALAGAYVATYAPDTTPPAVTATSPASGATGVDPYVAITATFNEALDPATVTSSSLELRDASNAVVAAKVRYDASSRTASLTPSAPLSASAVYTMTIWGGGTDPRVKDLAGNALVANLSWTFTTGTVGSCPCTIWSSSATPTTTAIVDNGPVEVGVKFRSDIGGYITGIRFYKGSGNTGTHVGSLWSSGGTLLASATFAGETAAGWQQVDFATPVQIAANTVYVASYFAPNGHYAGDAGYFASSGVDRSVLHALQDGESGGNGVYGYSSSSVFPSASYQSSNYWVDVVFATSLAPDTTSPTVTASTPATNAIDVVVTSPVTVKFSEAMDVATLSTSTLVLTGPGNVIVPATVSYDAATFTATLQPSATLSTSTVYTLTVKGGPADPRVKDLAGNALAANATWSFTTAASSQSTSVSIWDVSETPTNPSDSDTSSVELGVKFRTDVSGYITGIRFYKGTGNTGTHVGSLWSSGGTLLASATFTGETASGWQQADFATPVQIAANTVYVASYFAPNGHYAGDNSYFAAAGVDRGVLHALQDGVSGGNGVYAYGANSSFPSQTWSASNYWVDVVFANSVGPDTTSPTVTANTPATNAIDVVVNSPVTVKFSEAMDVATLSTSTLVLTGPGNAIVPATVSYDAATFTATLKPSAALSTSTVYTMTVKGGPADPRVKDLAGNALAANATWSFTTSSINPCSGNPIAAENCLAGNPASEWDVSGAGDPSIQGFATEISVNRGSTVSFKVDTTATDYRFDIYRMGYYGGLGARKVATLMPSATLPQNQPSCLSDAATGLVDCGNWAVSGSWTVPSNAASGIYFAKVVRSDTGGASHIVFVVRDDASTSDILFQTSDTTWQAYNSFGGNSLYVGSPAGRAYKVSYNRPFNTRAVDGGQDWVFNAEYPMVRWLEANGYDVVYSTGADSDRLGSLIRMHRVFLSVGHDEYWSAAQRTNVEAARDNGTHLAFFSGNEIFWKTRWENSIDASATPYRTLVSYKETHANAIVDPQDPPTWTGTWRDPRFSPPADGGRPENALSGTIFMVNDSPGTTTSITVPAADGKLRFWRNTSVANLASGATATLPFGTLGYEWDVDADNGFRPAGLMRLSTTSVSDISVLQDYGSSYANGAATHSLTLYKHASGALVFGAGTVQWAWGVDENHDRSGMPADVRMQQATVNLLADMSTQPTTLQSGLVAAVASTDTQAPVSSITSPTPGAALQVGSPIVISGTAADTGGGVAGGVEVSTDGGATWHPAIGRGAWNYSWTPSALGSVTIQSRAVDDSGNLESPSAGVSVSVGSLDTTPPTVINGTPADGATDAAVNSPVTVKFSEAMDPASISGSSLELRATATGSLVAATVGYDAASFSATLTPSAALATSTNYTMTVKGGAGDPRVKDVAGNVLAANVTWSFTTSASGQPSTTTIWDTTAIPANPSDADAGAVELGVKFRSDLGGYITGIRFYKGSGNTGTHIGSLWSSDGTLLASANFSNETASGWQQVSFATPVQITANTVYVASYFAPNGHYAGDNHYFANSGVDHGVLHALQDGVSGGNGVYAYGSSSSFPSHTWNASNYWVDVVFAN